MVICNRERIKQMDSEIDINSDLDPCPKQKNCCQNILHNPDIIDYRTKMDQLHFYEKTDYPCDDLWLIENEECLWQCLVGEIKTPYGVLSNSIGQATYGCRIWDLMGENIDSLMVREFESLIIETCLKYTEVNNVIDINTKIGNMDSFLVEITIDSIYGVFDGRIRIPNALPSNKKWVDSDALFHTSL